ncbi:MAG: CAP domain-containing protein [Candidatus Marsarchaeota archaeon]|nr:CAP domain-containing protein [Candidatus Marsarchaeota archaeon]MCL5111861.1 CAP domain-containing protein [Candidatus Marsarchaeota archaeon]
MLSGILSLIPSGMPQQGSTTPVSSNYTSTQTSTAGTSNASQPVLYALSLINQVRSSYGLQNVSLSGERSGQQHADSMLQYGYLSHWDIYGMKPYMRYTLLGGTGAVEENVAYIRNESCSLLGCRGTINVDSAIRSMEDSMLYNDSQCCNNGHRYNILNPNHNQVSIGVAYNSSTVYLVEDFIDNYIAWSGGTPAYSNGYVSLSGSAQSGYSISQVLVSYDAPVSNMSAAQLWNTSSYSYGQEIAGVASSPLYYYQGIETIDANRYSINGQSFSISFNINKQVSQYGPGEYTLMVWLSNGGSGENSTFVGATYTIFINGSGGSYTPKFV